MRFYWFYFKLWNTKNLNIQVVLFKNIYIIVSLGYFVVVVGLQSTFIIIINLFLKRLLRTIYISFFLHLFRHLWYLSWLPALYGNNGITKWYLHHLKKHIFYIKNGKSCQNQRYGQRNIKYLFFFIVKS